MDGQISLFDGSQPFRINKPIRLIEFFAGIGAQAAALERLGVPFESWKISEWDVYSTCSYRAIHRPDDTTDYSAGLSFGDLAQRLHRLGVSTNGKRALELSEIRRKGKDWCAGVYSNIVATRNMGSITGISASDLQITDTAHYIYFLTYSFPCQDLSLAGKQQGMARDAGTRSGLLWEFERILKEQAASGGEMPQMLMMENVPQVCGANNTAAFAEWLAQLEKLGYRNYYKIINAMDCGVPQNRARCFMFSLYGDYYMDFAPAVPLKLCALDMLEADVPQKYYIPAGDLVRVAAIGKRTMTFNTASGGGYINTLLARDHKDPALVVNPTYPSRGCLRGKNTGVGVTLQNVCTMLPVYALPSTPTAAATWRRRYLYSKTHGPGQSQ